MTILGLVSVVHIKGYGIIFVINKLGIDSLGTFTRKVAYDVNKNR